MVSASEGGGALGQLAGVCPVQCTPFSQRLKYDTLSDALDNAFRSLVLAPPPSCCCRRRPVRLARLENFPPEGSQFCRVAGRKISLEKTRERANECRTHPRGRARR